MLIGLMAKQRSGPGESAPSAHLDQPNSAAPQLQRYTWEQRDYREGKLASANYSCVRITASSSGYSRSEVFV